MSEPLLPVLRTPINPKARKRHLSESGADGNNENCTKKIKKNLLHEQILPCSSVPHTPSNASGRKDKKSNFKGKNLELFYNTCFLH